VIFSVVRYDEPDCRDAGIWGLKQRGLFGLTADAPAVALDERVHRDPGGPRTIGSTSFSQLALVGVKCSSKRGGLGSGARHWFTGG
jgi:hypothetical protein